MKWILEQHFYLPQHDIKLASALEYYYGEDQGSKAQTTRKEV